MLRKLLDKIKGSPIPGRRFVTIPAEEYRLLMVAAWNRGQRAQAQKQLKALNAWKMQNGL